MATWRSDYTSTYYCDCNTHSTYVGGSTGSSAGQWVIGSRSPTYDYRYACSCYAHGTPGGDQRKTTVWTQSEIIKLTQLTEMVNAAKAELNIRGQSSSASQIVTKSVGASIAPNDFNQMIDRVAKLRGLAKVSSNTFIYKSKLNEIQRKLNESQAECICNCDYLACSCNQCTCVRICTCDCNHCGCDCNRCSCMCDYCPCNCNRCSCDYNAYCWSVCSCNRICTCNQVCSCNCDYCGCDCNQCAHVYYS